MSDLLKRLVQLPPEKRAAVVSKLPPMSFAQQRLWFLNQMEPGSSFYNVPAFMRLSGDLKLSVLERTLNEIRRRHDVLRTTFAAIDGQALQIINPPVDTHLPFVDLSALDEAPRKTETQRLVDEELRRPFDLSVGPFLRVTLLWLGGEEYVALAMMHHIITDGSSVGVLTKEVATLYDAYAAGRPSPLPKLDIQYADYARWQRNLLQGEVLQEHLDYWKQQLGDLTELQLPTDHPRPPVQSHRGATQSFAVRHEVAQTLNKLARQEGATLFMTLLAAFQTLLHRYSSQDDIVVGTVIANRNRAEIQGLIGFLANALVIKTTFDDDPTFVEVVRQAREVCLGAFAHQELPFDRLVQELQPERDASRSPLFQVLFQLQNIPASSLELSGIRISGIGGESPTSKFDLSLLMTETPTGLLGAIEYATDLFDASTIDRLAVHMQTLLTDIAENPQRRVSQYSFLTDAELDHLRLTNQTRKELAREACVQQLFEEQVERTPDAVAIISAGEKLSYRELNKRGNQLAQHLRSLGVGPEVVVGICVERSAELVVGLLGILKAGGAYLPIDASLPLARISYMLEDAGVAVLLTQEKLSDALPAHWGQTVYLDSDWDEIATRSTANPAALVDGGNLAYVIYTSGSTGQPKGVLIEHRSLTNYLSWANDFYQTDNLQLAPLHTSISFDLCVTSIYPPLLSGLTVSLFAEGDELESLGSMLNESDRALVKLTPSHLRALGIGKQDANGFGAGHVLVVGGESLPEASVRWWREGAVQGRLINEYGPTEAVVGCCVHEVVPGRNGSAEVAIGRPIWNTEMYVLGREQELLPVGAIGELYIGGAGLARGYLGNAAVTAERFVPHPHGPAGERLYRTGDLGRYLANGEIEYLRRADEQVKIRGYRIELGEVEAVLSRHASVRECVVVAREDVNGDKRLVGYVVAQDVTVPELREHLRGSLPDYMVPSAIALLDELPLTANGKIDRRALPAPETLIVDEGVLESVLTPVEEMLAGIWSEVLNVTNIKPEDNFFELGGHSLLATQLVSRVREVFNIELSLRALFESPVLSVVAHRIEVEMRAEMGVPTPPLLRAERGAEAVVSFAQQRLWFIDQLEPNNALYNNPLAVRMSGDLKINALERTLTEIVRRHEVLRTTFQTVNGEPMQVVTPAAHIHLPLVDLSEMDQAEREAMVRRLAQEEGQQPTDLSRGPLLRLRLLRLDEQEHVVLLTMHHIISDGWSTGVLINEVATLYRAYYEGRESPLPELEVQYADFSIWQRGWLQGEVLAKQLSYWEEQLRGASTLELPTDRVRPASPTHRGARHSFMLGPELSEALEQLSRRQGTTLFMTVLAAFQALMARYSGQSDIVIGSDIAGRNRHEIEPLIGFFVNQLVLRTEVKDEETFSQLLARVREVCLGAYAHQDVPFEKLVEELRPERDLSRTPLFQVKMILENAPSSELELPGLKLSGIGGKLAMARFDLLLALSEVEERGLVGLWTYSTDLFNEATIERLSAHYLRVLHAITADPKQRIAELPLLGPEEQEQLRSWNRTEREYELDQCVHQRFEQHAAVAPEAVAVVFEQEQITYGELNTRANQLAHHLRSLGVGPEVLVGICLERGIEMVVAVLGIMKAGGAYVPLDPGYPMERLSTMLDDSQAPVLLTVERLLDNLPSSWAQVVCLDSESEMIAAQSVENPDATASPDNTAYVIYTSGTTGVPKGVMVAHRGVINLAQWQRSNFGITSESRISQFASYNFDAAVGESVMALLNGATLVMLDREDMEPAKLLRTLNEQRINVCVMVPSMLKELDPELLTNGEALSIVAVGEACPMELAVKWSRKCHFMNAYGPTEYTVYSHLWRVDEDEVTRLNCVPIGWPIHNSKSYILDANLEPLPAGLIGEIYISGPGIARGYLNKPELTAERFVANKFDGHTQHYERMYKTGDLARYLPDGNLEFRGRVDTQVKVRGFRIELAEIESVVLSHQDVRDCVVVTNDDERGVKSLNLYVVAHSSDLTATEIRGYIKGKLPDYMVPSAIVFMDELPLTSVGKIDRRALPSPNEVRAEVDTTLAKTLTPIEEMLASIWSEVLHITHVRAHENFFELGGHSLLATQLISRIREVFGVDLPLRVLFEGPALSQLASRIEHEMRAAVGIAAPPLTRTERGNEAVLSFAQQRLWFIDQLEPNNPLYNNPTAVRLSGDLKKNALERTLSEIVRRHEVLRTSFRTVNGEPVQVIAEATPLIMREMDLSDLEAVEQETTVHRLVQEEANEPFDLSSGPLLRVRLLRLASQEHVILMTMHHIISDGWSMGVFIHEVATLYRAYYEGHESPLPELEVQYADFSIWQRNWLQGEVLDKQLGYWDAQLRGAATLELPIDRAYTTSPSYRGARHMFMLEPEVGDALKELSQREGATLFMTLLAGFQALLSRYSGQTDIVVGTDIANRNRQEIEPLIGFFVNQLVLRSEVKPEQSFVELLAQVKEVCLGAYAHQDVPFEKLVEELQPERDLTRSPLFQVKLLLQNAPGGELELPGLTLSGVGGEGVMARFDLMLVVTETELGLAFRWLYSTDLFDESTIARMSDHFAEMLGSVVANPQQQIAELSLLTAAEREQLVQWNETQREYASNEFVPRLFEAQVERRPEAMAVLFEEQAISYDELNARANQLAHYLREVGVGPEVIVGICVERSVEMVVGLLGIMKAGGAYLPIDPSYPLDRISFMLEDAGVPVLLTQESVSETLPAHWGQTICLDSQWDEIAAHSTENPPSVVDGRNLAYLIYTSGSTGQPKGVLVDHANLAHSTAARLEYYGQESINAFLLLSSFAFDSSVAGLFGTLCSGASLVLAPEERYLEVAYLQELINRHRVSHLLTLPSFYSLLLAELDQDGPLKAVTVAGEACPNRLVAEHFALVPEIRLINEYGPTEASVWSSVYECLPEDEARQIPIGKPIANTQIYVLDQQQQLAPVGVTGEVYVGGLGITRGYLNQVALTAERFIPNSFGREGERLYRTGDVGRYLASGDLEYLGRADEQVKIRGYRIELGEVEAVLSRHASVRECVVIAREDTPGDKRLVGYVVAADGVTPSAAELREHLRVSLPEYMVPAAIVLLECLPLSANGKVDRRALPSPEEVRTDDESAPAKMTPIEEMLAGVWAEVLHVTYVRPNENFFELGGHSLLATQLISRIRDVFNVELPLRVLFESPVLSQLAQRIQVEMDADMGVQTPPLTRAERRDEIPLSFAQQRLWFLDQLEPNNPTYNNPLAVRLNGVLKKEALERTLTEIVRRHEVLRTSFPTIDGRAVQSIDEAEPVCLFEQDLTELEDVERETTVVRLAQDEATTPFDLSSGPLLRFKLLRLGPQDHVVLLTTHHIVSDGWSMGVLIDEVAALYRAYYEEKESPLADLEVQYADFAIWQRNWLQGEALDRQLHYWGEQLRGAATLELPVDKPRPAQPSYRGAGQSFALDAELSAGVKDLSRREGTTLFMTLLAAFQLLLSRYSGQDDIVVGTPIAGRNRQEIEPLIGFFVNTLVMRSAVDPAGNFNSLLSQVKETCLGAYAHQDIPFEKLVDELQPERDLSRSPLFQVMFQLQNVPGGELELPGLTLSGVGAETATSKFDLSLTLADTVIGEINGGIDYSTDLFEASTITRMSNHFVRILRAVVANPEQRLSELSLLTEEEFEQLLSWNAIERDVKPECMHELFEEQAAQTPESAAVIFGDKQLSYRELNSRANQLAHHLRRTNVGREVVVGICVERNFEMIVGLLGILKAGGTYLPIDPSYPRERISFMLEDASASVLLTQQHLLDQLPSVSCEVITVDAEWERIADESVENPSSLATPDNLGYIIYTSGSTGRPKGVGIEHRSAVTLVHWARGVFSSDVLRGVLASTSICFDLSVFELFVPLSCGGRIIIAENALVLPQLAAANEVTLLNTVPSAAAELIRTGGIPESVKTVNLAGEALPRALVEQLYDRETIAEVYNLYGPSEDTTYSTYALITSGETRAPGIGRPVMDTQVYVLGRELELLPVGVAGELYIGGAGLARGYIGRPELTAERFIPHLYTAQPGERLYRTGDVGRYLPNGELEYLGRVDQQVKIKGYRIELGEVEAALMAQDNVRDCVVVAREDEPGHKRLVAYVVAEEHVDATTLRDSLRVKLPEYLVPAIFVFLERLPLNANGKVDRRALPAPDASHLSQSLQFMPPRSAVEAMLARIWADVLGLERVGIHDNFFDLGGDSILSIQIVSRAAAEGARLTAKQLFQHQTIAALAQVTAVDVDGTSWADQGIVTGPVALTPIQRWFFAQQRVNQDHFNQSVMLRLSADVRVSWLRESVAALLRHHDALRMRFTLADDGQWQQFNEAVDETIVTVHEVDLGQLSDPAQAIAEVAEQAQRSLSLHHGPLLRAVLLRLGADEESRLLLAIHHLVVDGVSWRILLEDLQTAYEQVRRGAMVQLPSKTSSFQQWAALLTEYAASEQLNKDARYWSQQPWQRVRRLPQDHEGRRNRRGDVRQASASLSREQTAWLLQEAPAAYRTRIQDLLLTALARVIGEWTESDVVALELEGHGREESVADVARTVGWFTTIYPVLLRVDTDVSSDKDANEEIGALIKSVKEQLRAVPEGGLSYGVQRYMRSGGADVVKSEVLFNYLGQLDQVLGAGAERSAKEDEIVEKLIAGVAGESSGTGEDPDAEREHLLEINGAVAGGQLGLRWNYSAAQFNPETIEALAQRYREELVRLIEHCREEHAGGRTPSDFPLARLSQSEVDQIAGDGRAVEDIYPVTPLQQGLLFHALYAPDGGFYHQQLGCNIGGGFDAAMFVRAWHQVIDRHEILRTGFVWEGLSTPLQVVQRRAQLPVDEYDWRDLPAEEQAERWEQVRLADRTRGFELDHASLMRLSIARVSDDSYRLLWSHHHLLLDGWCLSLVIRDVFTAYEQQRRGIEVEQQESRPYRDYIAWLQQQDLGEAEQFWRETLRGFNQPTALPMARRRTDVEHPTDSEQGQRWLRLTLEQTQQLNEIARREQVTMGTVLLGAWALLLARYSGTSDVVFGTTVSGRPAELAGVEQMIGLFINTLPVRVQVKEDRRVWDWLRELQGQQLEMRQYEYSPLAQVQTWSEVEAGQGLFETLLTYENFPMHKSMKAGDRGSQGGVRVREVEVWERTNYPLTVLAMPGAELLIEFTYERERFEDASIERIAARLGAILDEIASGAKENVAAIEMLGAGERRQLLEDWNRTEREYELDQCVHQRFEQHAAVAPEAVAVIFEQEQITYGELNTRANQLAHHLRSLGVGPEVLVGICLERGIEMVVAVLGIMKAGGAYVPLDPGYPMERLSTMLDDSQAPVLLTVESLLDNLPSSWAQVVCLDSESETIAAQSAENPDATASPDNTAYVIYTSGTTGVPKGVMVAHRGVINLAQWQRSNFGITSESRISQFASYNFDAAVGESVMALLNGATLVMLDREDMEPAKLIRTLNEQRINVCVMVPSMLKELDPELLTNGEALSIVAVGEACPMELAVKWSRKCHFMNAYGPTEYTVYSHLWRVDEDEVTRLNCVPIGWPIHNSKSYILDANLEPVPAGMVGEIYISGPGIARGYLNKPDLTAERFLPNKFNEETAFVDYGHMLLESVVPEIRRFKEYWDGDHENGHVAEWQKSISPETVYQLVQTLDADLQDRTHAFVNKYSSKSAVYQGFCRYLIEGANKTYASSGINSEVLRRLLPFENFEGLRGVDFGFGHGEVMQALVGLGASMRGLDFNPVFVQQCRAKGLDVQMGKVDVSPETFADESGIEEASQDFAISTLLLDRLETPINSLKNLFQILKDGGRFAIQTLLPIVGVDDGDVEDPIIYTPEIFRITPGKDALEDSEVLVSLLRSCGGGDISVYRLPYVVTSRDGLQEYTLWSFTGTKVAQRERHSHYYDRMYKTGDLGRYLPDGNIEFRGRVDTQVKVRGFRIELAEIEAVLLTHQEVRDCVVIATDDARGEISIVAYVVSQSSELSTSEIRGYLKDKLPDYMVPAAIVFMDELPLTSVGKIDRRALPAPDEAREADTALTPTLTPVEELLTGIWAEVLHVNQVRVNDNFFELGGHSLLGTQLVSRIREVLGVDLPLRTLFEVPVLSLLAERIDAEMRTERGVQAPPLQRVERGPEAVLSFAQQRLWFLNQLEPDSAFYNSPMAVRLVGALKKTALDQTLTEIVRRHEVLRTTFKIVNGEPVQVIAEPAWMRLPEIDLSELEGPQLEAMVQSLANAEASAPFDLSRGPLLRVKLLRTAVNEHVVLLTMHHVISDGWSLAVFINEVAELYRAYYEGRESSLPELEVQYADFAIWQRNWLQGEALDAQLRYWEEQLRGAATLELPTDRERPVIQNYRGSVYAFALGPELSEGLRELSRREGTTLFMTMLAAFKLLLSRYSGQTDIVVGAPIAGRTRHEVEPLIGFFINSLTLRTSLSGDPSFKELLRRVREVCLGAYAHQEVPFEKLVEELQPERDASRAPFFEVTFGLQNAPVGSLEMPELELRPVTVDSESVRYDLTMWIVEAPEGLGGRWSYKTDLFDEKTIQRMQAHYRTLLESIVREPEARLSRLEMHTEAERQEQQLKDQKVFESNRRKFLGARPTVVQKIAAEPSTDYTDQPAPSGD